MGLFSWLSGSKKTENTRLWTSPRTGNTYVKSSGNGRKGKTEGWFNSKKK